MPIDPSIPLQIQPQTQQNIGAPIQTAANLLSLKSGMMQLNANQAISDAYAQSVDPNTGQVDFNKLQALASQNGAGAFLPQFMGQIAQQRNSQLQYQQGQLELALKQQQDIRNRIGSLALAPELGKSDMSSAISQQIAEAVQTGTLPLEAGIQEMKSIPADPQQQAAWIRQHLMNSLSGEAKLQALMPHVQTVDTGGQIVTLASAPMTGQPTVTGVIGKTLTPGEQTANVDVVDPTTGAHYAITKAQQLAMGAGGAQGGYTGRPGQAGGIPGGLQTSLAPGQQTALAAQAGTSNTAAQTLHDTAADAPMRVSWLEQARDNLGPINTGPSSDFINAAKSFVNTLSPSVAKSLGWTGDVQNYDEFKKILTNYASVVSGSLGTGTDARLNAAITGNANPNISKLANEDILAKTIAAEKMRQAQDYAFQNSGLTTDKFNQWQSQWNKAVDPNTFAFAAMNPTQQAALIGRLQKSGQLNAFKNSLATMINSGYIQPPGGSR